MPLEVNSLTPRQTQVVELARNGMTNKQIAAELGCRPGTVKIHLMTAKKKLGDLGLNRTKIGKHRLLLAELAQFREDQKRLNWWFEHGGMFSKREALDDAMRRGA